MGKAAVAAAKAIGYTNAGTVEFIVDDQNRFYFLEVNTRLQVEHPITELVIRQDLVRAQLTVAMGHPLPFTQRDIVQDGHAIECRIYAEDPDNQFLPSTGTLQLYREPHGPGIRVDSGVRQGSAVTIHYDPMLSKLIVWAKDRTAALAKMVWALKHYPILGVTTNTAFLRDILLHEAFVQGDIDTHFLERYPAASLRQPAQQQDLALAMAAVALERPIGMGQALSQGSDNLAVIQDPWVTAGAWRG
jgi:acetyl/propionyl-CoA carboxylase alpha subunit